MVFIIRYYHYVIVVFAGVGDLVDVWEKLLDVSHKWYDLGLKLRLPLGALDSIKYQHLDAPTSMREMLTSWLKKVDPPPTWEALANALESRVVGEPQLAQQLRSKYCTTVQGK